MEELLGIILPGFWKLRVTNDPNDHGDSYSNPNKIQKIGMEGGVIQFCRNEQTKRFAISSWIAPFFYIQVFEYRDTTWSKVGDLEINRLNHNVQTLRPIMQPCLSGKKCNMLPTDHNGLCFS